MSYFPDDPIWYHSMQYCNCPQCKPADEHYDPSVDSADWIDVAPSFTTDPRLMDFMKWIKEKESRTEGNFVHSLKGLQEEDREFMTLLDANAKYMLSLND